MPTSPSDTPIPDAYRQTADAVLATLGSDRQQGLTEAEAGARLARDGRNELIAEPPIPAWRRFLAQFQDVLVILLLFATAISAAVWWYERDTAAPYEALAILTIVLLNAVIGYVQEARAEEAVAALRAMSAADATVIRGGEQRRVPATDIVAGDIVVIEEGDTIPADIRVVQSVALHVAEAALTGESLPVSKSPAPIEGEPALGDRRNMLFSGTSATYGHGTGVVVATGMRTEMGRIAGMLVRTEDEETPLQQQLDRLGKRLGVIVVVIAAVIVSTILWVEDITETSEIVDVLILGVALAVAAVPEGLPAVVTAVLALGVRRMAQRKAIVRHLAAVETLGSATIIASDKTGTLTRNEMTARVVVTASGRVHLGGAGYSPSGEVTDDTGTTDAGALHVEVERALIAGDLANNAVVQERDGRWTVRGDPTEGALIVAARKAGLHLEQIGKRFERVGEVPFSSERKLMSTVHLDAEREERLIVFTKGAPDVLLAHCTHELVGTGTRPLAEDRRREIARVNDELAHGALRTLGVAFRSLHRHALDGGAADDRVEHDLVFTGLIGMIDPPRSEAADAVARTKAAGIRPVMITGDHPTTAAVIARELGILTDGRALSGADLERLSDGELTREVATVSVFARVNPSHKMRIVDALQADGGVVAMTGDGVNDAPALKAADIGVAMGITGTDVSKEAADIILADDNFATIVAAVEEGRAIFSNIRKFLRYLLSSNVGEVLTMFGGVVFADLLGARAIDHVLVLPLLATQILWINLVTDGAPALALGVDPASPDVMARPPRARAEGVITGGMWAGIVFVGLVMAVGTLLVFDASLPGGLIEGTGNLVYAQTMAFTTLMLFQMFNTLNARSDERSAFDGLFSNHWLWAGIGLSVVLQFAVLHLPFMQAAFGTMALDASDWLVCTLVASSVLWLRELSKLVVRATRRDA